MDGTKAPMKLKGYLAENGIKQQEIADLLGIDVKNVNQKLNGNLKDFVSFYICPPNSG